jgi:hypothetical protein
MNKDNFEKKETGEAEAAMLIRGRKFGFLLAISSLPEEVKDDLAVLAQVMRPEDQDQFLDVFEAKYLDEQSFEADKELHKQLGELIKKYEAEDLARARNLAAAIGKIKA